MQMQFSSRCSVPVILSRCGLAAGLLLLCSASAFAKGLSADKQPGLLIDDTEAVYVGSWVSSHSIGPFFNEGYQHDNNSDKGAKTATFTARVPEDGYYHVLFAYTSGGNRSTKTPVTVKSASGEKTLTVNQRQNPDLLAFVDLGEFEFKNETDASVIVSNADTDGHVIVDAVQFVTPDELEVLLKLAKQKPVVANKATKKEETAKPVPKLVFNRVAPPSGSVLTPADLDAMIAERIGKESLANQITDEVFLRRVSLDIAGRQPTVEELEAFLADTSENKRTAAIDRLLQVSDYGQNWGNYWSDTIAARQQEPELTFHDYKPFKAWLADQFNAGKGWDEIVFDVLTANGKVGDNPAATFIAFHQANDKRLAGEASRVFLSVQIACAECHDHPFVDMPTETFHGMAAFFVRTNAKIPRNDSSQISLLSKDDGEYKIPGRKEELQPTALNGMQGESQFDLGLADLDRRRSLAEWMVHPENPYFARSYVNRVFARLIGRGFYEPVDDLGETASEPILPEVHAALAEHFITSGHDHKDLVRLLTSSRVYQRSMTPPPGMDPETPLAAAVPKKLRGDEIFDSLVTAIKLPNFTPEQAKATGAIRFPPPPKSTRDLVNDAFGYDPSFKDDLLVRSMKQAMFMMNNTQIQAQINADPQSETYLSKLLTEEQDDSRVATRLYRAVLGRSPSDKELDLVLAHLEKVGERGPGFEDVLWSLINSAEFVTRR